MEEPDKVARGGLACVRPALKYGAIAEEFKLLEIASIALRAVCDESLAHLGTSPFGCAGGGGRRRECGGGENRK